MNRKGQALIEFVLILPVFLLILFTIVDFGNILSSKNRLESTSTDVVRLVLNGEDKSTILNEYKDISIDIQSYNTNYRRVIVSKEVRVITPFLDRILGNPYLVRVERVIPNA